jgi:hypothetical protein
MIVTDLSRPTFHDQHFMSDFSRQDAFTSFSSLEEMNEFLPGEEWDDLYWFIHIEMFLVTRRICFRRCFVVIIVFVYFCLQVAERFRICGHLEFVFIKAF